MNLKPLTRPGEMSAVLRVIDGDTIDVLSPSLRIRLAGLDNPEICHPHREPEPAGFLCAQALRQLASGRDCLLYKDPAQPSIDPYGRTIAFVAILPGTWDLGNALIRAGWAWPTPWFGSAARQLYAQSLRFALDNALGIWSPNLPVPRGAHAERILRRHTPPVLVPPKAVLQEPPQS